MRLTLNVMTCLAMLGCARSTRSLQPVTGFDVQRYEGKWYEIARFPHWFERGLSAVTADYEVQPNGSIRVENRGYDPKRGRWKSVTGRAYPKGSANVGLLKVTFFWPFYGTYRVLRLDKGGYSHALVTSDTFEYLWVLSRTPTLDKGITDGLVRDAAQMGFDIDRLGYVDQSANTGSTER